MKNILITGGTGLIGKRLSSILKSNGYHVRLLSREKINHKSDQVFTWNINKRSLDQNALKDVDHIIHLAGAGIADEKWSNKRKKDIIDSRVISTELLYNSVKKQKVPLKTFISASAIGYYGSITSETIFKETDQPASDFLGKVCNLWEQSTFQFKKLKIRTVALRTGIVLSNNGGALKKITGPIIAPLGNGKQYMPWIHIDDLCKLYIHAIEDDRFKGAYNAVSPEHQTNYSFSKTVAKIYKTPLLPIGAPKFILKAILGEMSTIILNGSRISSNKIKTLGFKFDYEKLENALKNLT